MSTMKFNKWQSVDGVTRNAVLQVVSSEISTTFSTTSTSFVDVTGMSLAITPTSATSKILCLFDIHMASSRASSVAYTAIRLKRDSTVIFSPFTTNATGSYSVGVSATGSTSIFVPSRVPITFLDTPSTTNQITYQLQTRVYDSTSSGTSLFNSAATSDSLTSTITLMEIAQ